MQVFQGVPPEDNLIAHNVCVGKWIEAGWHAKPEMLRLESNLTNAFSSLACSPNDQSPVTEFELNKDSPAWALGFRRIPAAQIGLPEDELRHAVERLASVLERPPKRLPEHRP